MSQLTLELFVKLMSLFIMICFGLDQSSAFEEGVLEILGEPERPAPSSSNLLNQWSLRAHSYVGKAKAALKSKATEGNLHLGILTARFSTNDPVAKSNESLVKVLFKDASELRGNGGCQLSPVYLGDCAEAALMDFTEADRASVVKIYLGNLGLLRLEVN